MFLLTTIKLITISIFFGIICSVCNSGADTSLKNYYHNETTIRKESNNTQAKAPTKINYIGIGNTVDKDVTQPGNQLNLTDGNTDFASLLADKPEMLEFKNAVVGLEIYTDSKGPYKCSGTVLSGYRVLTAAHCLAVVDAEVTKIIVHYNQDGYTQKTDTFEKYMNEFTLSDIEDYAHANASNEKFRIEFDTAIITLHLKAFFSYSLKAINPVLDQNIISDPALLEWEKTSFVDGVSKFVPPTKSSFYAISWGSRSMFHWEHWKADGMFTEEFIWHDDSITAPNINTYKHLYFEFGPEAESGDSGGPIVWCSVTSNDCKLLGVISESVRQELYLAPIPGLFLNLYQRYLFQILQPISGLKLIK